MSLGNKDTNIQQHKVAFKNFLKVFVMLLETNNDFSYLP